MRARPSAVLACLLALWAPGLAPAQSPAQSPARNAGEAPAGPPLSAIDWLSNSVSQTRPRPAPPEGGGESTAQGASQNGGQNVAITPGVVTEPVTVAPLDRPVPDGAGILPAVTTGLPRDLWAASRPGDLAQQLRALPADLPPAMQDLLYLLLLAELDPPQGAASSGETFFLARLDKLLELGALDRAESLGAQIEAPSPAIFRRVFDIALLLGHEDRACDTLLASPALAPTPPAQIFCLVRAGDWQAAALALEAGRALGTIEPTEEALLARFLDPELFEGEPPPPVPARITPLVFRLYEAIGEPIPTAELPLAFARADLRPNVGWKGRLAAGERLARTGAIDANELFALYTERAPAGSGGVWERVRAVQALDAALSPGPQTGETPAPNAAPEPVAQRTETDDAARPAPDQLAQPLVRALLAAWPAFRAVGIEVPMARIFGPRLIARLGSLPEAEAREVGLALALLSDAYEEAALALAPADAREALLFAIARGAPAGASARNEAERAVVAGLSMQAVPARLRALVDQGRKGEALLRSLALVRRGMEGDLAALADGLGTLRVLGLEDSARRAALQALLIGPEA